MTKKLVSLLIAVLFLLSVSACAPILLPTEPAIPFTEPTEYTTSSTEPSATVVETAPAHSLLYIPGLDVEDVIRYFNEVCLDAEFAISGDASVLQKWTSPILYTVNGDPTVEDLSVLSAFTAWLNTIDGFPGIMEVDSPELANLQLHFCTRREMLDLMGRDYNDLDGAMTFWYNDNEIYDAIICVRTDLAQNVRNSVIQEEIYNVLGPAQDTDLRRDSMIYSGYSTPQELTEIDELILKLLYHPDLQCGMTADDCETMIRLIYD